MSGRAVYASVAAWLLDDEDEPLFEEVRGHKEESTSRRQVAWACV